MKRAILFVLIFMVLSSSSVFANWWEHATDLWFQTSDGSTWAYERDDGSVFTTEMQEKALNLDKSIVSVFNYSTFQDEFFDRICSNEDNGPFGTFQVLAPGMDIYGFAGHGAKGFIRDLAVEWFANKSGSMLTLSAWNRLNGQQVLCDLSNLARDDSISGLNKWRLFEGTVEAGGEWHVATYYADGVIGEKPRTIRISCFGRVKEIEHKADADVFKVEFGASIFRGGTVWDSEVAFATFWLISQIGPVKIQDGTGSMSILKDYNIVKKGQSINPDSGKIASTWGAIKK